MITNEHGSQEIDVFEGEDGDCYVFLPSYAELAQVTVVMDGLKDVTLGGVPLTDGISYGSFEPETEYELTIGEQTAGLRFLQSANVAALYIDTVSGTMDHIHEERIFARAGADGR